MSFQQGKRHQMKQASYRPKILPALAPDDSEETMDDALPYADRDSPPFTAEEFSRMRMVARVKTLRTTLRLTQGEFAERYQIPIGTLRDWEQSRAEPDATARTYLNVIAGDPEGVIRALARAPKRPAKP
jgi:putative transcriptional regulator